MDKEIILDLDDFFESNNRLDLLFQLKAQIPNFKVTLFTVPGLCSKEFCQEVAKLDWVQLALHGDIHSEKECKNWTKEQTLEYLNKYEAWGCFQKIFKAPFWIGSLGLYEGLKEKMYRLAINNQDVDYPDVYRHYLNSNNIHGHINNVVGNGLEDILNDILDKKDYKFNFIK